MTKKASSITFMNGGKLLSLSNVRKKHKPNFRGREHDKHGNLL